MPRARRGTATRRFPLTIVTNKHLLPIYDRPMIYYLIETLTGIEIHEAMILVGGKSVCDVVELVADDERFGLEAELVERLRAAS